MCTSLSITITCLILCTVLVPSSTQQLHEILHPSLSITLHSLSSLPFLSTADANYTSLTLSRLARDEARVHSLLSANSRSKSKPHFSSPVFSGVRLGTGEYIARVGVGRPAKQFYLAIDTGSDVSWLQCRPCSPCYPQSDPIFNPADSSTFKPLSCRSRQCAALDVSACSRRGNCLYEVGYGDGSYTIGGFATETISFGSSASAADVAIGCGNDNEGLFSGSAGLLGLGGGSLSLPSQINATSFSYCLVNRDSRSSSTLDFNSAAPAESITAPLLNNPRISTFYYVALTGISIGGRTLRIQPSQFAIGRRGRGGVIVDSGTTVTRFPSAVYRAMRDAFRNMSRNLRFAATSGSMSIIGNIQQQGTRVSYNLAEKSIGFSPNKC